MNILGYIVHFFHEDKLLPETGYKHLHKTFSEALDTARGRLQEYLVSLDGHMQEPYELVTPTKKQADQQGFAIVFRNPEIQIWIDVVVQ